MREELRKLVERAIRAPSSHNTQPWRFRATADGLALSADRTRSLPLNDPHDRELMISCGAVLFHLRVAAAAAGYRAQVTPGESEGSEALASITLLPGPPGDEAGLAQAIDERSTIREPFGPEPVVPELLPALEAAARREGAWLAWVPPPRDALAELIAEGNRRQFADPRWRRELAAWIRPRGAGEGLALPGPSFLSRWVVRTFDIGERIARRDAELARSAPLLAVLGTSGDGPSDWLRAGQALGRVLLTAAREGIQAGYLNQPIQVEALRPLVAQQLSQAGHPQLCLRLGRPIRPGPRSSRRPVDDLR